MKFEEFIASLDQHQPPVSLSAELKSLWFDKNDEWEQAHDLAQEIPGSSGSWIHAYLHRKEGDQWNADYWYRKAGKSSPASSLDQEWEVLVKAFL